MCGIAGIAGPGPAPDGAIASMLDALVHRGPDGRRACTFERGECTVTLGATRLAVIDRSPAGLMPLLDPATGSAIVFNGELYNYREIREVLLARGASFLSATDTEVALHALLAWGPDALRRFRGMYALGLWNQVEGTLLLARDFAGKKPLYHASTPRGLVFCSEVRALLASGTVPRRLDDEGLLTYLANGFPVAPTTLVRGVRSLLPGTAMTVRPDGSCAAPARYWQLAPPPQAGEPREPDEAVAGLLRQAVRRRLRSDAPLGVLLSSGLDSTSVAGVARGLVEGPIHSLTVGSFDPRFDETRLAARFAAQLGLVHREHRVERDDLDGLMRAALAALDQPSIDGAQVHVACAAARRAGWTVVLAGAGADELFGSYFFVHGARLVRWLLTQPLALADRLVNLHPVLAGRLRSRMAEARAAGGPDSALRAHQMVEALFSPSELRGLVRRDVPEALAASWGLPQDFVRFAEPELEGRRGLDAQSVVGWRTYLGERQLRDGDQASMASSIELRAPFLDQDLVSAVISVPARRRTAGWATKRYQRSLVRPLLPVRLQVPLRKRGFALPVHAWMDGLGENCGVDAPALERIGVPHLRLRAAARRGSAAGPALPARQRWAVMVLATWAARHRLSL